MDREEINTYWMGRWEKENRPRWHMNNVNCYLKRFFSRLTNKNVTNAERILVPLCGATVDMVWLYEKGLTVVGVELSEIAIKKFFSDNDLTYSVTESSVMPECKIFTHDTRLQIFQVDIFKLSPEVLGGKFDYWFDRGSLIAMVEEEQEKYADSIKSVISSNGGCLMECFEYDPTLRTGPPRSIKLDKLTSLFGKIYDIEELIRLKEHELDEEYDSARMDFDNVRVYYLLKAK